MSEENSNAAGEAKTAQNPGFQFAIQRIYIKDLSFETPNGLLAPKADTPPKMHQDLNTSIKRIAEDVYEVSLHITIKVDVDDENTAYLVEVKQAGLFVVKGLEGEPLQKFLASQCPQIIFPYARETIDSTVVRAGFPALALPQLNFDALYAQAVQQQARQRSETESAEAQKH